MAPYSKNFLTQVIARIDYQPILILDKENPSNFQEQVREEYPRFEKLRNVALNITPKADSSISFEKLPVVWKLSDKEKANIIDLSSKYFALQTSKYIRFSDFYHRLTNAWNHFVENYKPQIITRIGLRYINEIRLTGNGNPFDWENLINTNLYSSLNAFTDIKESISRSMNQLHFAQEDCKITFTFGIFNSEFPNTITQKEFILDYDCISEDEYDSQDVLGVIKQFNDKVWDLFERSIGDGLRDIMKKEGDS